MLVNQRAAAIHRHMCTCPKHGYTQGGARWGQGPNSPCYLTLDGIPFEIPGNDFDCSSSVKKAWELALKGTAYEGILGYNGYDRWGNWQSWYTGNEIDLFVGSGLFSWEPMSFTADTGDLYLNVKNHVAMCQTQVPDVLSEFLSNEWGGITGGQVGDQTGGESVVRAFWWPSFGWDGILHYNGKADEDDMEASEILGYRNPNMKLRPNSENIDSFQMWWNASHQLTRTDDAGWGTGDGHDFYGRLNSIQKDVIEMKDTVKKLQTGNTSIDYDKLAAKLAPAVADEFYKRMKN